MDERVSALEASRAAKDAGTLSAVDVREDMHAEHTSLREDMHAQHAAIRTKIGEVRERVVRLETLGGVESD